MLINYELSLEQLLSPRALLSSLFVLGLAALVADYARMLRLRSKLPPGPMPFPIVGNTFQLPVSRGPLVPGAQSAYAELNLPLPPTTPTGHQTLDHLCPMEQTARHAHRYRLDRSQPHPLAQ